jgi:hypothetical protein
MNQPQDPNETAPIYWGDTPMADSQWHGLDQLWLCVTTHAHERLLSYCYSETGNHRAMQQFGRLTEYRYPASANLDNKLVVRQKLSPRPVVVRPIQPIHLPAGASVTLYVGTSLWLSLEQDDNALIELPVARLSDTWFGPDTVQGEVCYASQTHARLSLEGTPANPYKAMTPVKIKNDANRPLVLDRINLPIPHLTLYQQQASQSLQQRYWTSAISMTMTNTAASSDVELRIERNAPTECEGAEQLALPREPLATGKLRKALTFLLG